MMTAYFYNAKCADAFRLEYTGNDGSIHNIMIDGGFSATYRQLLRSEINKIEIIDLWIATHLHDDHINGIVAYIKDVNQSIMMDKVQMWLYNLPRWEDVVKISDDVSVATGMRSSNILSSFLIAKSKNRSNIVAGNSVNIAGLQIEVLSPDESSLSLLQSKYSNKDVDFEHIEDCKVSSSMSAKTDDYHYRLENFTLDMFEEDDNVENGSSIATLITYEGKSVLWLSDSHPSIIISALSNLGYSKKNPLSCDIVQVAHHGSRLNNSLLLFEMIKCKTYIFSANGENRYYLPSKLTLARILRNPQRDVVNDRYQIHFTADNKTLRRIFAIDTKDIFDRLNFEVYYNNSKAIQIDL